MDKLIKASIDATGFTKTFLREQMHTEMDNHKKEKIRFLERQSGAIGRLKQGESSSATGAGKKKKIDKDLLQQDSQQEGGQEEGGQEKEEEEWEEEEGEAEQEEGEAEQEDSSASH